MNYLSSFKKLSRAKQVAVLLVISMFTWAVGVPAFFTSASAAQLSSISATASSSAMLASTNYIIQYTAVNPVNTGSSTLIQFSYSKSGGTDEFSLASLAGADVSSPDISIITSGCGAVTANQMSISGGITNSAGNRSVSLTACGVVSAGTKHIVFSNSHVINPATAGSYKINITNQSAGFVVTDTGMTMVAILSQVTVTAQVDTTLTFTVAGVATGGGNNVNGENISTTTSATAIGFGTLASGTAQIAAQDLTVTTNAQNGFIVTVHEDQNLLSSNGADIDLFSNGSAIATPAAWATPTAVLGNENTYGHIGITSDDTDLNANEFDSGGLIKWAGNFYATTTRTIFSNAGPSDGVTQNVGKARVGYKILVSSLQEAATDYTNHLIYVCTPTF